MGASSAQTGLDPSTATVVTTAPCALGDARPRLRCPGKGPPVWSNKSPCSEGHMGQCPLWSPQNSQEGLTQAPHLQCALGAAPPL